MCTPDINNRRSVIATGIQWHDGITKAEIAESIGDTKFIEWAKKTNFGRPCAGCNKVLETEYDFAAHFVISRWDFWRGLFNLGECPVKLKARGKSDE